MKIIQYNPNEIENVSLFFNNEIEKYKDSEKFIMFIFEDILKEVKDETLFKESYENLLIDFDLPYAFYPYNMHFNKVYKEFKSIYHPLIQGVREGKTFNIISEPAFGMLVLDLNKLKDFKFNEEYKISFYIQDLIFYCKKNNLWISDGFFIDIDKSWKFFKSNLNNGYLPNVDQFKKEKELFFKNNSQAEKSISDFIQTLRERFNGSDKVQILEDLSKELKGE